MCRTKLFCLLLFTLVSDTYSWHWHIVRDPNMVPCSPLHFMCAYTEECCVGVCLQKTVLKVIKYRVCTLGNDLEDLPKKKDVNYFKRLQYMKNVSMQSEQEELLRERFGIKPKDEEGVGPQKPEALGTGYETNDNVQSKSTLYHSGKDLDDEKQNLYKSIGIPLNTPHPSYLENMMMDRVPKNSPMYGGPLNNLTSNHKVPNDKFHNILLNKEQ